MRTALQAVLCLSAMALLLASCALEDSEIDMVTITAESDAFVWELYRGTILSYHHEDGILSDLPGTLEMHVYDFRTGEYVDDAGETHVVPVAELGRWLWKDPDTEARSGSWVYAGQVVELKGYRIAILDVHVGDDDASSYVRVGITHE